MCPSIFIVSTIPSAVRGFTKLDAQSRGSVPSFMTMQLAAGRHLYCVYIPPPTTLTTLPSNSCAFAPASITTPEPSLPTGIGLFSLGSMAPIIAFGTSIMIFESSALRVLISPGPINKPRSDGLMGVAST